MAEIATAMVYSPGLMEDRREAPSVEELEKRVEELEGITDRLGAVRDEDLVGTLDRAVSLLREINAGIEAGIHQTGEETRNLDTLLGGMDFGPFDRAMEEFEGRDPGGNTGGTTG